MKKFTFLSFFLFLIFQGQAQYCAPTFSSAVEPITSVKFAYRDAITSSEVVNGTLALQLLGSFYSFGEGASYNIIIKGNTAGNYTNHIGVFIDYNNDNDFNDANEYTYIGSITNSTGLDAISASGTIAIPSGTTAGVKRMRVLKTFDFLAITNPCCNTTYGQAEDYIVNIENANPYCTPAFPDGIEPITKVSFRGSPIRTTTNIVNEFSDYEIMNYTSDVMQGLVGGSYYIEIEGNTNGNFTNLVYVYVDWNDDKDFLDPAETVNFGALFNSTGIDGQKVTGFISVPPNATNGDKRLRIIKKYAVAPDGCNKTGFGQAEDYTFKVVSAGAYCTPNFGDGIEPITRVSFRGVIKNASTAVVNGSLGYENFTDIKMFGIAGNTYPIAVKGNTNGNFINYVDAMIDWNEDNDFNDANEIVYLGNITNSTGLDAIEVSNNIMVPLGTLIGNKRLRITKRYSSSAAPCNITGFGQAEEYTFVVYNLAPYCTDNMTSGTEPITKVSFSGVDNVTSNIINETPENEDFTMQTGTVVLNSSFPITVKGNTAGTFTSYFSACIDWNNDNDFNDVNEINYIGSLFNSTGLDALFATANITVPLGTTFGPKRLRVIKKYGLAAFPFIPNACNTTGIGQAEDYTLNIVANIDAVLASGNVFLKGKYIEVGINQCGGWGTTAVAPNGYHPRSGTIFNYKNEKHLGFVADPAKDGWTVGVPDMYNGDYFLPAAPLVGWGLSFNGTHYGTDRNNSTNLNCGLIDNGPTATFGGSNTTILNTPTKNIGIWEGTNNGVKMQKITTLKQDKLYFTAQIKLYNTTAAAINNMYYGEYVDIEPSFFTGDVSTSNSNSTNTIVFQNPADGKALIQGIGAFNNIYLGLGSKDCRAKVFRSLSVPQGKGNVETWYTNPTSLNMSQLGGDVGLQDRFIGIGFNIGTLAAGDSTTFTYTWILKAEDFNDALAETEPSFTSGAKLTPNGGTITPCSNTTFNTKITDGDYYNWTWSPATGLNTTLGKTVDITVGTSAITYTITGVSTSGCPGKTISLVVEPLSVIPITLTPNPIVKCLADDAVPFGITGGGFTNATILAETFNAEGDLWSKDNFSTLGTPANAAFTLRQNGYDYNGNIFNSNNNSQFYLCNSDAQGSGSTTNTALISNAFNTLNTTSANLTFYHNFRYGGIGAAYTKVQISLDGVNYTDLVSYPNNANIGTSSNFILENVAIPLAFLNQPTVFIKFAYKTDYGWYWAIDNIKLVGNGNAINWLATNGIFTDAASTLPFNGLNTPATLYANPPVNGAYGVNNNIGACTQNNILSVIVNNPSSPNGLSGIVGGIQECKAAVVSVAGTNYFDNNCNLIANILPTGASPVTGNINTCVKIENTVLTDGAGKPFAQRFFDVDPTLNPNTSTAIVKLYFTQQEFDNFNAYVTTNALAFPLLPTGGVDNGNGRITQFHREYDGMGNLINLVINFIVPIVIYNNVYARWEVSFPITQFSGFFLHTGPLPLLSVNNLQLAAFKNGNNNILNFSLPQDAIGTKLVVLKSDDGVNFTPITEMLLSNYVNITNNNKNFTYTDYNINTTKQYYKIMLQVNNNTTFFSNTKVLTSINIALDISVFPNPTNGIITFNNKDNNTKYHLQILDASGKTILQNVTTTANTTINLSNYAKGVYILKATEIGTKKITNFKIIKQ